MRCRGRQNDPLDGLTEQDRERIRVAGLSVPMPGLEAFAVDTPKVPIRSTDVLPGKKTAQPIPPPTVKRKGKR